MVLFGDSVVFVCWTSPLQDDACMPFGGEWNKQVYNKYIFTARLLGC